jgi:hypothetical protein
MVIASDQSACSFEKAYLLFDEAMQMDSEKLSQLEKEGIIQRFEVVIELAWKTLYRDNLM